jgi:hypothetical protein
MCSDKLRLVSTSLPDIQLVNMTGFQMIYLIMKYMITAGIVVLVSELAKRSDKLGGLIGALPLVTVLSLIWLYVEQQPTSKISNHAYYTFWYVLPTLPMFLLFPSLLPRWGFALSLTACVVFTVLLFASYAALLKQFGIDLL